jgi:hypothetical protein
MLTLMPSAAQARLFNPKLDGICRTIAEARRVHGVRAHLFYHPTRDGQQCWYQKGAGKKKAKPVKHPKPAAPARRRMVDPQSFDPYSLPPDLVEQAREQEAATLLAIERLMGRPLFEQWISFESRWRQTGGR